MLLLASPTKDTKKTSTMSRNRASALCCLLLWPLRSSAFLLNLTCPPPACGRSRAAAIAALAGKSRGPEGWSRRSTVRLRAAAEGSGYNPKVEKVSARFSVACVGKQHSRANSRVCPTEKKTCVCGDHVTMRRCNSAAPIPAGHPAVHALPLLDYSKTFITALKRWSAGRMKRVCVCVVCCGNDLREKISLSLSLSPPSLLTVVARRCFSNVGCTR